MYFQYDEELDDNKREEGRKKLNALPHGEKQEYASQLFSHLRQQAYYAGLDTVDACQLFKKLYLHDKNRIEMRINIKDNDDNEDCCSSGRGDLLELLQSLKRKFKEEKPKDSEKKEEADKKDSEVH